MNKPTSFSQNNVFTNCPRWWFYHYVKKIPQMQDMCYADAGTVLHNTLQKYYDKEFKDNEEMKEFFNKEWASKKLDNTILRLRKDNYWLMVINGINLKKNFTSTEFKIFFPDVVGYIDGINTEDDEIIDWKSSTRSKANEEEYRRQLSFYSYLYKRKFDRLPKKAIVYYLKYNGSKSELTFEPTNKDIFDAEDWHWKTREKMGKIIRENKVPPMCEKCHFFCPYQNLCGNGIDNRLKYTLHLTDGKLQLDGPISQMLNKGIENKFSYELKNAYWIKKNNPHANTIINFWNLRHRQLPIGFFWGIQKTLRDYAEFKKVPIEIEIKDYREFDKTMIEMPESFVNGKQLRDYQKEAVEEFIKKKIGILEIGTGGGKTLVATEIIRRLGVKTLFVVDKIELLRQTKKVLEESLGIEVGQLGGGKKDIKDITVATIQTLVKDIKGYSKYLSNIRLCILDEVHKAAAKSYYRLGKYLINAEFKMGISGTAFRDDGNDMMINAATGYKVYDLSGKKLIDKGWLVKPTIKFIRNYMNDEDIRKAKENSNVGLINETAKYAKYYNNFIVLNPKRNDYIRKLADENKDKKILILVKLIDHGNILEDTISKSRYLYGETNKTEREQIFKQFVDGELNVLISTISIFAEGIDIPKLDMVINAAANRGDVKTIQVLGRVLRKLDGKKEAFYIDFVDESKFFYTASLARRKALTNEGHDIKVEDVILEDNK